MTLQPPPLTHTYMQVWSIDPDFVNSLLAYAPPSTSHLPPLPPPHLLCTVRVLKNVSLLSPPPTSPSPTLTVTQAGFWRLIRCCPHPTIPTYDQQPLDKNNKIQKEWSTKRDLHVTSLYPHSLYRLNHDRESAEMIVYISYTYWVVIEDRIHIVYVLIRQRWSYT